MESKESEDEAIIRRRLADLVEDLRVALPGVQVLFGFLLTLPFSSRSSVLSDGGERTAYFLAFVAAATSSILLIAPSALHRLYHEMSDPGGLRSLFVISGWLAVFGLIFLAITMASVVYLVTDVLFRHVVASLAMGVAVVLTGWLWFALPLLHRLHESGASR